MYIIKLNYLKPMEVIDKLRPAHLEFLDKYYAKNIFIASGRRNPPVGGIIITTKIDKNHLDEIIKEDPFHIEKVAEYEVIEFTPNKFNPAIKDLVA